MENPAPQILDAQPALRLRDIGKVYRSFRRPSDRLKQLFFGGRRTYYVEHAALVGIDLDVPRGQTVGIVGRNGSGKSTLLRILCGVLLPTRGTVSARGRIAPLLALGAGFNPDFTGRENVLLNAAILGLTDEEIAERFAEIAAFAGIGDALEAPVSTYSSGMFARLAFSVAVCVSPDILVVDEILSVGDSAFARKCFARMEAIKAQGATILFVSHSATAVRELCDRAILLEGGKLVDDGTPREVLRHYNRLLHPGAAVPQSIEHRVPCTAATNHATNSDDMIGWFDPALETIDPTIGEGDDVRLLWPRFEGPDGAIRNRIRRGGRGELCFDIESDRPIEDACFSYNLRTITGIIAAGETWPARGEHLSIEAGQRLTVRFPIEMHLTPGDYFLTISVATRHEDGFLQRLGDVAAFVVESDATHEQRGYAAIGVGVPRIELLEPRPDAEG